MVKWASWNSPSHTLLYSPPSLLKAWLDKSEEEGDGPAVAALVGQVMEGWWPSSESPQTWTAEGTAC